MGLISLSLLAVILHPLARHFHSLLPRDLKSKHSL